MAFEKKLKSGLTAKGWPGRLANAILEQARAKLSSKDPIAKRELRQAQLKFKERPCNETHGRLQYWEARQNYHHFCLGDRKALAEIQQIQGSIAALEATPATADRFPQLQVLQQLRDTAVASWKESRLFPVVSVGGKDEGPWLNKTIFLREKPGAQSPLECEFVIKYPRFLAPQVKGRFLPVMGVPVKLSQRAWDDWQIALTGKIALTFTIQPLDGRRWQVTGVFKEPKAPKFACLQDQRIGIDQNAGFITVACVQGTKIRWVRKIRISQKGTTEQHEERIHRAMHQVVDWAKEEQALIVIEDLNLADKHKEFLSKKLRRRIQRIPYRKLQEILGRICCREGANLRMVNPAYTSILGRFQLPGMQVHLAAAAMIAWRDLGCDQVTLFQVGQNGLKIMGEDSPILVEIQEGMPCVQRNAADPRFLTAFYKFVKGVNALISQDCQEREADGQSRIGGSKVRSHTHGGELGAPRCRGRTVHDQTCPAAGTGTRLSVIVRPQPTPRKAKSRNKTVALTA